MRAGAVKRLSAGARLHVVQVTDTHLKRDPGGKLVGMDTDNSLHHVLEQVMAERDSIDLVLGTGDVSDHGSEAAYRRAETFFARLGAPVGWLVGNHDDAESMARVLGRDGQLDRAFQSERWLVIMLNSQIPGEVGGELGAAELAWLRECLEHARANTLFCLVCLHHQPVAIGSEWIDQQMVSDHRDFFELIDRSESVRGVLWGHVHQQIDRQRGAVKLMATPSSCVQFAPGSRDFRLDDQPPGYRWLELRDDGTIETGVSRVQGVRFEVDLDSKGYL
jgi:Icc protein